MRPGTRSDGHAVTRTGRANPTRSVVGTRGARGGAGRGLTYPLVWLPLSLVSRTHPSAARRNLPAPDITRATAVGNTAPMTNGQHGRKAAHEHAEVQRDAAEEFVGAGVRIGHERPAPETVTHVIAPLIVVLADGTRLVARKWWLGGISDPVLKGHDLEGARLSVPFQGLDVGFPVRLIAKGADGPWAFEDLTGRQREALGLFYKNLLTGKMAATGEVITALDTPVDLIPMGETEEEKAVGTAQAKPRAFRTVLNILWYVALFGVLVGFLGGFAWSRIEGITLSHARVYADRQDLRAPREGYLTRVEDAQESVADGTLLARVEDPQIESALADVHARIGILENRIAEGRARLALHRSMREEVRATLVRLYSDAAMARFDAGISIRPGDHNDQKAQMEQELRRFEADLARARSELRNLRQQRTSMRIEAPTGGMVAEWIAGEGQYLRTGDPVAVFETEAPRVVRAWLDDRVTGAVRPGMTAEITLPGTGRNRRIDGRVTMVEAGANPAEPDRFGLIVTVEAEALDAAETRARLPFNAPAQVVVKRGLLARWLGIGA